MGERREISQPKLVLLPGLDGTGILFQWLLKALPMSVNAVVVRYPKDEPLGYSELIEIARQQLPQDSAYILLAESFSGPIAIHLAAEKPPGLHAIVLVGTFVAQPLNRLMRSIAKCLGACLFRLPIPLWCIKWLLMNRDSENIAKALKEILSVVSADVLARRVRAAIDTDVTMELKKVTVPVLHIMPTRDRLLSKSSAMAVAKALPKTTVISIEGPHFLVQCAPDKAAQVIVGVLCSPSSTHMSK